MSQITQKSKVFIKKLIKLLPYGHKHVWSKGISIKSSLTNKTDCELPSYYKPI